MASENTPSTKPQAKAVPKQLTEEERREKIRLGLMLKKECDTKALTIVERLLDPTEREWFRTAAFYLNESYYNDVVEERSCIQVCGYPLCQKRVENNSSKKYRISTKQNKVFDITERKKFCSNMCFKSSEHYKDQLLTSPLWMREPKDQTPIVFFDEIGQKEKSCFEVKGGGEEFKFFQATAAAAADTSNTTAKHKKTVDEEKAEIPETEVQADRPHEPLPMELETTTAKPPPPTPEIDELTQKMAGAAIDKKRDKKPKKVGALAATDGVTVDSLTRVEQVMREWFTIDTFRLVEGDDYVRQVLRENECTVENVMAVLGPSEEDSSDIGSGHLVTANLRSKYIQLCRNLDLRELEESEEDLRHKEESFEGRKSDFSADKKRDALEKMREEAEIERLKISSYFKGKTEYEMEDRRSRPSSGRKAKDVVPDIEERPQMEPRIPLIDKYAQCALRRRVVHEQLDRVLPDVLQLLGILRRDVNDQINRFVLSFALDAENIILKPEEWTLIAIILIQMVAGQDGKTHDCMESASSLKYLKMLLLSYGADPSWLRTRIEGFHADIHQLIAKMKLTSATTTG